MHRGGDLLSALQVDAVGFGGWITRCWHDLPARVLQTNSFCQASPRDLGDQCRKKGDPEATEPHKRGYLAYVWEAVGRAALEQVLGTAEARARNGAAGALEEDARLTALFLWALQSTDGNGEEPSPRPSPRGRGSGEEGDEEEEEEEEVRPLRHKGRGRRRDSV